MESSDVIVLTPAGQVEAGLAIAACRAGARGLLDLEWAEEGAASREALGRLARLARNPFGVKCRPDAVEGVLARLKDAKLGTVLLCGEDSPAWSGAVAALRAANVEVLREAVTLADARHGVELAVDGLVLKGHEAGGRVGPDGAFLLIQKWRQFADAKGVALPFWVQGGIGPHSAAACLAAGARGVVLDSQLLLARESPASEELRKRIAGCDGGETALLGGAYRAYARADSAAARDVLERDETALTLETIRERLTGDPATGLWLVGQDVALAAALAAKHVTVAGIVQAVAEHATRLTGLARRLNPLAEGGPLAKSHGTRYPILQGPMTRVSDTAAFADAVAAGGALPFLALALSRKAETETLLAETRRRLGSRPWGVGILGFVPPEIRQEQLDAVRQHTPPFAIIAGGRPDQARELEAHGTAAYLHVPSPGLLRMFLKDGARRFIFEGRECGGHVGPRSSFALWESLVGVLAEHVASTPGDDIHAVFAGGIHDGLSASMVAALTAGLADRGVKVGVLLGTAYLFTREAVAAGAITERFQAEALACGDTVLLETGPGHAIRCIPTPYANTFDAEKRRLKAEGKSPLEVGLALERMNLGRLRVASKGVDRVASAGSSSGLAPLTADEQHARGMYMIGQVAALRNAVTTIAELHAEVAAGLPSASLSELRIPHSTIPPAPPPCDVAVVGMSCFYPRSNGLWAYWENILSKVNAVTEVPGTHWDWRPFYDPDPRAKDKSISRWGGFLEDITFDPLKYGITPKSLPCIEPLQLLLLEAVNRALGDAGYLDRPFDRERTCAILGIGGGGLPLSVAYGFRSCMPLIDSIPGVPVRSQEIVALGEGMLPEWTEDSFPGILLNVAAGRVANRFNLGGPNMAIDAACGSSLAALYAGVRELNDGTSDVAVVMGADAVQTPFAYIAFSKTYALSAKGRCRPFDAQADGIALAEGVGVMVLKRLADAERDGDRIYSVIKGVGSSSDGRDKGLTAPRAEGQLRALHRAYAQARVSPARVGLVEAHGTGTVVGDQTEARALGQVFREAGGDAQSCALGSVKSMIGHSKCAAGLAGLVKTAFALHHKVLPPTLVESPNPKANLDGGPLYLNTEARPWVHGADYPRTAGVSAFGFGGTNFHAVMEEYTGDYLDRPSAGMRTWPAELCVWRRSELPALLSSVTQCRDALAAGAKPLLAELAASLWQSSRHAANAPTLAVVATSLDDLREKLDHALSAIPAAKGIHTDPRGIYFTPSPTPAPVAFLFPGQGSQYPDMLAQLAMTFPDVRSVLDEADRTLAGRLEKPLSRFVYPPSAFGAEQEAAHAQELKRTDVAQPAIGAASLGMFRLLTALGVEPDFLAGHSYGEYAALAAAGAMSERDLFAISHRRGQIIKEVGAAGGMAAVDATPQTLEPLLKGISDVWLASQNSPRQTVLAGTDAGLKAALAAASAAGLRAQRLPVACGFHSPLIADAHAPLAEALRAIPFNAPRKPVYSNTTAAPHGEPAGFADQLAGHLLAPVRFQAEVEALHAAGVRVFVEVGPQAVLTGLTGQILAHKPHVALASDVKSRPGLLQLAHLLGQLLTHGVNATLDRLFQGRGLQPLDLAKLGPDTGKVKLPPTTWVINSVRSRPLNGPEPRLLGQALPAGTPVPAVKPAPPTAKPLAVAAPSTSTPMPTPSPLPVRERPTMNTPTHANGTPAATLPADAAAVMMRFQDVMARFLETQRSVMLQYLGAGGSASVLPPLPSLNGHAPHAPLPNGNGHAPVVPQAVRDRLAAPPTAQVPPPVEVVAAPEPVAPPPVKPAPAGPMDRDTLLAQLLELVSERTGYPVESLSIDLDLEADLGIDSIKRVEILGTLAESLDNGADGQAPALEMEKLSVIKTLRGIADYVSNALHATPEAAPAKGAPTAPAADHHPGARQGEVQRLVVNLIDAPLAERPRFVLPTGTVLLTDDGQGTARELADRLAELDVKTALLHHGPATGDRFAADLGDPDAVAALLPRLRERCGTIAGLIHLLPLAEPPAHETAEERMRREVKSLYLLARGLEPDIREAGKSGGALLLAVTALGGRLGYGAELPASFFPGHGGISGFTKCMAYEWPEALVRVVDVNAEQPASQLAEQLLAELADRDGPVEVGFSDEGRVSWQCDPGPLDRDEPAVTLAPGANVLITGGARGITAKVAAELAKRFQPRLVLVGRSPEPIPEDPATSALTTPAELKAVLTKRLQSQGQPAAPAAVEAAYRRLMTAREIHANLATIREAGGSVDYRSLDVRDTAAFEALLDELNQQGGIAGVIHGAGIIDDKLLRDKTPESFDRVFGTKVESAATLARKLDPAKLQFFALFSSITSRYGNRGQSDYAAANEVLSKLACQLDSRWPGRVVSIGWGPWAEVGMVADLEKHLVARGLKLIAPEQGAAFAVDEVIFGRKGTPEVVIAGGSEQAARVAKPTATEAAVPVGVS